jgi:hypothetical protein
MARGSKMLMEKYPHQAFVSLVAGRLGSITR